MELSGHKMQVQPRGLEERDFLEVGVEFSDSPVAPAWPSETLELPLNLSSSDRSGEWCSLLHCEYFCPLLFCPAEINYRDNFWSHPSLLAQWDSARLHPGPGKAAEGFSLAPFSSGVVIPVGVNRLCILNILVEINYAKCTFSFGCLSKEIPSSWSQQCLGIANFGV